MILKDVIYEAINWDLPKDVEDISITGVADNSKEIKNGYLFVAVNGYKEDGHNYIKDAIRQGASVCDWRSRHKGIGCSLSTSGEQQKGIRCNREKVLWRSQQSSAK